MIITRTPLRISFVGGGTDMPSFFEKHGGAVLSMAIDKYMYVSINPKFDGRIRLSYSRTENVESPASIKHDLVRNCLERFEISGVEITSVSDIPDGSGLGSSSAFMVGLMNAITRYRCNRHATPHELAERAFTIEASCGHYCGKQDHYSAAYGGLHFFRFLEDGRVEVEPICLEDEEDKKFQAQLMLFWTGKTRKAGKILKQQHRSVIGTAESVALHLRELAFCTRENLLLGGINIGERIHEDWMFKKQLVEGISNDQIDYLYEHARMLGAEGGKLCGAGGGGFLLICAQPRYHEEISVFMHKEGLRRLHFHKSIKGSEIIYG